MEENLRNLKAEGVRRSEFCTRADVRRIEKMIEEETIRLASKDGDSVLQWVQVLRERGYHVEMKGSNDKPPEGSGLAHDSFVLIVQTKYQRDCWRKHGRHFAALDATRNTTHYENMSLFTLLVRDRWGHGEH
jgi:exosome complex RNA-binding protein Csl4